VERIEEQSGQKPHEIVAAVGIGRKRAQRNLSGSICRRTDEFSKKAVVLVHTERSVRARGNVKKSHGFLLLFSP
jgi:hypothetical protein